MDMTGIQTKRNPFFLRHALADRTQLFKIPAQFTAFAGHRFQADQHVMIIFFERLIQAFNDSRQPFFRRRLDAGTGMQNQIPRTDRRGPGQLLLQKANAQFKGIRILNIAQIDDIGRVHDHVF